MFLPLLGSWLPSCVAHTVLLPFDKWFAVRLEYPILVQRWLTSLNLFSFIPSPSTFLFFFFFLLVLCWIVNRTWEHKNSIKMLKELFLKTPLATKGIRQKISLTGLWISMQLGTCTDLFYSVCYVLVYINIRRTSGHGRGCHIFRVSIPTNYCEIRENSLLCITYSNGDQTFWTS